MSATPSLYDAPHQMEPLLPREERLEELRSRASELIWRAKQLSKSCPPGTALELRERLRAMNSYYSNRIEGQHTLPSELEEALHRDFSKDSDLARRQRLAISHMAVERRLEEGPNAIEEVWSDEFLRGLHRSLFEEFTSDELVMAEGDLLIPGEFRSRNVQVGTHEAPAFQAIPSMLARWREVYSRPPSGELRVLAILASHHRLTWIHPFRDGNGRVSRLHTLAALSGNGLTAGLWSPLRGLARKHEEYEARLISADHPRRGDFDGRGNLTEEGLLQWIGWALDVCLDQIDFMSKSLGLDELNEMKGRIAACLLFEQEVKKSGIKTECLNALHYLFMSGGELGRGEFKQMLGLGERTAGRQLSALLDRELVKSNTPYGALRFGVPLHALRFYFPKLWPEAEAEFSA